MELYKQLILTTIVLVVLASTLFSSKLRKHPKKNPVPETAGSWPIIGHLHLLVGSKLPHKVLATMADTTGPIFTIRLGKKKSVVINSSELAHECLLLNDTAVSGRPKLVATDLLCYNYAMFGFGPNNSYWRQMRKTVVLELLSNQKLNTLSHVWKSEVKMFVSDLYSNKDMGPVNLSRRIGDLTMNIIVQIIRGKRFGGEEGLEFGDVVRKYMEHLGSFAIGDALPYLRWLDLGGQEKAMKRNFSKIDYILQRWLDEVKENKVIKSEKGFMDVLVCVLDHDAIQDCNFDVDTINKATCLTMIIGGSDTTTVTIIWAISLLLNNPHVLRRAKDELATQVGKDRQINESDIPHLVYLQAIVKETLRLYPAAPILAIREFIQDCTIGGYQIETGNRLIVNVHKISRDPLVWEDPLEFKPERFLGKHKDVDVRGNHFDLIPFGAGRRICPGVSFGLQVVHLTLASILHAFEMSTQSNGPVDMGETFGLTSMKTQALDVLISPILSSNAYM